jgi:hypothetical protein
LPSNVVQIESIGDSYAIGRIKEGDVVSVNKVTAAGGFEKYGNRSDFELLVCDEI